MAGLLSDVEHHQPAMTASLLNRFCRTSRTLPRCLSAISGEQAQYQRYIRLFLSTFHITDRDAFCAYALLAGAHGVDFRRNYRALLRGSAVLQCSRPAHPVAVLQPSRVRFHLGCPLCPARRGAVACRLAAGGWQAWGGWQLVVSVDHKTA